MGKKSLKQNGGKREGSGRKKAKHTLASEKAREYLILQIRRHLAPIVAAQIDSAKGLSYVGRNGKIYINIPDTKVGEYLLNQIAGKPSVNTELGNESSFVLKLDV